MIITLNVALCSISNVISFLNFLVGISYLIVLFIFKYSFIFFRDYFILFPITFNYFFQLICSRPHFDSFFEYLKADNLALNCVPLTTVVHKISDHHPEKYVAS